ncbi:hypothetical protein [Salinispira pacifica]|uniref:Uncharacterized protein n=1 Tax=Salinispira pacifica TaxID=1307761 RepID=V5WD58_9SPIO|nr:hypothetical protein [Salinispira pacifica]AHC13515.1 hypothetical protein L21SP2_0069 [Salinispira pacifica]
MNSLNRKMLLIQLITHVSAMLTIVVLTIVFIPANFESYFSGQWIFSSSVVHYLDYFIPIVSVGFVICFSMAAGHDDIQGGRSKGSFFAVIQGALVFLLSAVIVYTLLLLLLLPVAEQNRLDAEYRSDFIADRVEEGQAALERQDYATAEEAANAILDLVPRHNEGREIFRQVQERRPRSSSDSGGEEPEPRLPLDLSYGEILDRARQYYAEEDYFSAVFYSRLALGPDESRDEPEARRILSDSLRQISRLNLDDRESDAQELYSQKTRGAKEYNEGNYLDSYYTFQAILQSHPGDPDAATYLEYLEPEVREISFFIDEIARAAQGDLRRHVFLQVPGEAGDDPDTLNPRDYRRFIAAEQMMRSTTGMYFINLEYLVVDRDGGVKEHLKAPRAKLRGNYLITHAIDRENPQRSYKPRYIVRGDVIFRSPAGSDANVDEHVIRMALDNDELWSVSPGTAFYDDVNLFQLFALSRIYPEYGRNPDFPRAEILDRILLPFSLINLSILVIIMSWRGRSRYLSGPPVYTWIFVPVIPVFSLGLFELYRLVFRNMLNSVLILFGFIPAMISLVVLQTLLFILILFFIAGQRLE